MNIKLICNPNAGGGRAKEIAHKVEQYFIRHHAEYNLEFTYRQGGGILLAQLAASRRFDIIAAIGGDGTANEVLNGMMNSSSVLGIIPAGTGNDFPRMLGLSDDLEQACDTILNGKNRTIDVGKINAQYFLNGAGFGFDAEIGKQAKENKLKLTGKDISKLEIAKLLFKFKPPKVTLNLDGAKIEKEILFITIGNGKSFGGGFLLTPQADLEDGFLDVCITDKIGKLKALFNLKKALTGRHLKLPFVSMLKSKSIKIDSTDPLTVQVDGEIYEGQSPYLIKIFPRSLTVKSRI